MRAWLFLYTYGKVTIKLYHTCSVPYMRDTNEDMDELDDVRDDNVISHMLSKIRFSRASKEQTGSAASRGTRRSRSQGSDTGASSAHTSPRPQAAGDNRPAPIFTDVPKLTLMSLPPELREHIFRRTYPTDLARISRVNTSLALTAADVLERRMNAIRPVHFDQIPTHYHRASQLAQREFDTTYAGTVAKQLDDRAQQVVIHLATLDTLAELPPNIIALHAKRIARMCTDPESNFLVREYALDALSNLDREELIKHTAVVSQMSRDPYLAVRNAAERILYKIAQSKTTPREITPDIAETRAAASDTQAEQMAYVRERAVLMSLYGRKLSDGNRRVSIRSGLGA